MNDITMLPLHETRSGGSSGLANVSRRAFVLGLTAGALVLTARLSPASAQEKAYGGDAMPGGLKEDPRIFLAIQADGTVELLCPRAEMGQGVRTSWAMVVADELEGDFARFQVRQAPGDQARFGNQNTDGSRSMRHHFGPLRRIGAAARHMLQDEAAARWSVPVSEVHAEHHEVLHRASGRRLGFGALAGGAATRALPSRQTLTFKAPDRFRYIGRDAISLVDNADITTGKAVYGIDAQIAGMIFAVVARAPVLGAKVKSFDAGEALKVPGVLKVVPIDALSIPSAFQPLGGIAVVAENTFAAIKGRSRLTIEWEDGPNGSYDSAEYRSTIEAVAAQPGKVVRDNGNVDAALAQAAKRVAASYYIPHLAHAPMEPPTATARVTSEAAEVWASVQAPEAIRADFTKRFGLPADKITITPLLLGGGFGRKSKPDFATEAAILSRAMEGRPVKLTFTREDDIQHSFFHTVSVERLEAGLNAEGRPLAWLHRTAAPTIRSTFMPDPKQQGPVELAMGAVDIPFAIPNVRVENPEAPAHTRIGWFRSVFNIPHAFAVQSFVNELAVAAQRDPKDYLLELIGPDRVIDPASLSDEWVYGEDPKLYPFDTGRLKRVIEKAASEVGWGRQLPQGRGLGIAAHRSFVSYAAVVVEVAMGANGAFEIPRVDIALDCGAVVNPDRVRAQLEGAVIQGVSLAMLGEITFKAGRVEQTNFNDYEVTRIDAAPREIRTHLLTPTGYDAPLGGVGEPGVPPVAPALTNAIYAATGKRIRSLPIRNQLA
ncbi:xanthine dehydrogenase family protein molybdopterin-binding subunit [Ancylobacter polymorphus]|uniref:Molybdopterin-dependent oxidoreductase n=1 Tax=Ancylobacter polymorphus TaxID=223390 RepID=A0A9E6ZX67_9HYPH|nr:molybdopterin cofactor-binding domain-containing protein [Ancylobacter polymorphus]UOK73379.1 molybdopterin-dependent oxidoreductase [Ancylobacter polymorphus]